MSFFWHRSDFGPATGTVINYAEVVLKITERKQFNDHSQFVGVGVGPTRTRNLQTWYINSWLTSVGRSMQILAQFTQVERSRMKFRSGKTSRLLWVNNACCILFSVACKQALRMGYSEICFRMARGQKLGGEGGRACNGPCTIWVVTFRFWT